MNTRNEIMAVGVSSTIIATRRERNTFYARNTSTGGQRITISFGGNPVADLAGIVLLPGEHVLDIEVSPNLPAWDGAIMAVSDVADGQISIYEK